jgi:hypothetical protein
MAFQAGQDLIREGVDPLHIDGGYAFCGWFGYGVPPPPLAEGLIPGESWWVHDLTQAVHPRYVLTLSTVERNQPLKHYVSLFGIDRRLKYDIYKTYTYRNCWPWGQKTFYVLRVEFRQFPRARLGR